MTPFDDPIPGLQRRVAVWSELHLDGGLAAALRGVEVLVTPASWLRDAAAEAWPDGAAVVALMGPEWGFLRSGDADLIWRKFHVPVFVRLCASMAVVAAECEAHDGLHLVLDSRDWAVEAGTLLVHGAPLVRVADCREEPCGCGVTSCKLRGIAPLVKTKAA